MSDLFSFAAIRLALSLLAGLKKNVSIPLAHEVFDFGAAFA